MKETIKDYQKGELKISRLSPDKVEDIITKLGSCDRMTPYEIQVMLKDKVAGDSLSREIIKMRNEGW